MYPSACGMAMSGVTRTGYVLHVSVSSGGDLHVCPHVAVRVLCLLKEKMQAS